MFIVTMQAEEITCGKVFNDTFDQAGALPAEWTEYKAAGNVTVGNGSMKFNHNSTKPAFKIYDLYGRLVLSENQMKEKINIEQLSNGFYVVKNESDVFQASSKLRIN